MGSWRSLIEMEENLTLDELYLLRNAQHDAEYRRNKFMAALKGIDLDEQQEAADFERVKRQAAAELAGVSEEQYVFDLIGIEVDDDD